ncbi:MAG TPA: c-type cytochrome [Bryobacteraceae bacterium]|nr:c-type cytochrome [Bryobacteraceae bacterium]
MTRPLLLLLAGAALACAQDSAALVKQGERVFAKTCATGYCHGARGASSGAPRLAARGFNQAYIASVVVRGIPNTGMQGFAGRLPNADLAAVISYVAALNGVVNPNPGFGGPAATGPSGPQLTGEAARGALLFREALRGFGRCSTCHEVGGFGISVASLIAQVPASVDALKALATPNVKTATLDGESMPALVLSDGKQGAQFYDLGATPPVERDVLPGSVKFSEGSGWRHASAITAYSDAELNAILAYLHAVAQP